MPEETMYSTRFGQVEARLLHPAYRLMEVPTRVRAAGVRVGTKGSREAENINAWDEVPDSSWFTNRIGRGPLSRTELLRQQEAGPDMSGRWKIIAGKSAGVSSGFTVLDARGDMYFIKFDVIGHEGLVTGAEIISTLIMNAAGYNVPHNYLRFVGANQFVLVEGAQTPGKYGEKREMTRADLSEIFSNVDRRADGRMRIVASKALDGRPVGFFLMEGTRPHDLNDRIPHENRRELRGAHVFSAWLNNPDIRVGNTLDMYVGEPGKGYIQHYLIDFGSSLGSSGKGPKDPSDGYDLYVDYEASLKNLATLGFHTAYWENNKESPYSSVGLYEYHNFRPLDWTPWWPNPAWTAMTPRDGFWAARIIARFTDADLGAIVSQALLPEPDAEAYLLRALIKRRDKLVAAWFNALTPLDDFRLESDTASLEPHLVFENLAPSFGIADAAKLRHTYAIRPGRRARGGRNETHTIQPDGATLRIPLSRVTCRAPTHGRVDIQVTDGDEEIGGGVRVYLFCQSERDCLITGLERRY